MVARTRASSNLVLWNNDLAGETVLGVGDGMVHDTDAANHLCSDSRGEKVRCVRVRVGCVRVRIRYVRWDV